mmetsp:Transcript_9688/g.24209  ORF Transcript_9688/g.24209 Transcript_9688/m.24209 type:complete len:129 (-) Transcript_9688:65-451(-)
MPIWSEAETVGIIHLAKLTVQTRWAAKALDTAEKKQCAWLNGWKCWDNIKFIVHNNLGRRDDPCYATAKDTLTKAEGSSKDGRQAVRCVVLFQTRHNMHKGDGDRHRSLCCRHDDAPPSPSDLLAFQW